MIVSLELESIDTEIASVTSEVLEDTIDTREAHGAADVATDEAGNILGNMLAIPADMPGISEGGIPNGLGNSGIEEILILSISDSCSRLVFALRFWNQIFTWKYNLMETLDSFK